MQIWCCRSLIVLHPSCSFPLDESGALKDASQVRIFLMMHPWYIPSTDMAKKLVLKYPFSLA